MLLVELVKTSGRVAATRGRLEKIGLLAEVIARLPPDLVAVGVGYLAGDLPQGKIGVGYARLRESIVMGTLKGSPSPPAMVRAGQSPAAPHALFQIAAAAEPTLSLRQVHQALDAVKTEGGAGSTERRQEKLGALFARATADERAFLLRLLTGELRQGALEGVMIEAVARAFKAPPAEVRRAVMLAGALPPVAEALGAEGPASLRRFDLRLFSPVQPMLADSAEDIGAAFERLGEAALEYKLDGARVQVHKDGDQIEVWTRQLHRVTPAVPEVVERVAALPARRLVLDGEALAVGPKGGPLPFQVTMRRFGRRLEVERLRRELPLEVMFFDVLSLDGQTLIDQPLVERVRALDVATGGSSQVPRLLTADLDQARVFAAQAVVEGHEGVMAKAPSSLYAAGRRGQEWLKIKTVHTLDLVVLAAEWGSGRRQGWLSNLHLGARDPDRGGFVMLGKTFKGMTDEILRWQTEALLARELGREGHIVHVRPELVVEIAFNDVQRSPQYPGGVALRFARLRRYRPDKRPEDADTLERVRSFLPVVV